MLRASGPRSSKHETPIHSSYDKESKLAKIRAAFEATITQRMKVFRDRLSGFTYGLLKTMPCSGAATNSLMLDATELWSVCLTSKDKIAVQHSHGNKH